MYFKFQIFGSVLNKIVICKYYIFISPNEFHKNRKIKNKNYEDWL